MRKEAVQKCIQFIRSEAVLCVAVALAIVSAFIVPPSAAYAEYIDWNTLALLFSLMAVMKGFQQSGFFVYLGSQLVQKTKTTRQILFVLVFLPFVLSMVITNDVALISFVPFGLVVLQMTGQERLAVPLLVLQTLAANLGSMLTPMGNPQNLYLYTRSGVQFGTLCLWMLPYTAAAAVILAVLCAICKSEPASRPQIGAQFGSKKMLLFSTIGFVLCLLAVFDVLPPAVVAGITFVFLLVTDRKLLGSVDYALLGTFAAFFIFVGNIGSIDVFQDFLSKNLRNHTELAAVLTSQVTSNVPAALLLARFTDDWRALTVGCNLGGLGTLIASMASLISYKQLAKKYPEKRGKYMAVFTVCNVGVLAVLLLLSLVIEPAGL